MKNILIGDLTNWADVLVDYAEDWDKHFGKFFTQEFWYLLVPVTVGFWNETPLSVGAVKAQMKGLEGSDDRTKDASIKAAEKAGFIKRSSFSALDKELATEPEKLTTELCICCRLLRFRPKCGNICRQLLRTQEKH